jgi:aldehyde:ferredoxin oxidoreductase
VKGWTGRILRVELGSGKAIAQSYDADLAMKFIGGRGFAAKILWDEVRATTDPLAPESTLVFAAGPLTGFAIPSSGKIIVAAKSPLTGGYGEGQIGTYASVNLRKAGFDVIAIRGRAERASLISIDDDKVTVADASHLWGLGTAETEKKLIAEHGRSIGTLVIGPAGERLIPFSTVISMAGRSGGRPGMGAVMGSKKLKAIIVRGTKTLSAADPDQLRSLGTEAYRTILSKPGYKSWKNLGTMSTVDWAQKTCVLPAFNFRECQFHEYEKINGETMNGMRIQTRGCPFCNMTCGNVVNDAETRESELDYENVAMLGSNIGLADLAKVSVLNRIADDYGLDTISLGSVVGFAMECSEKKLIDERIEWGNFDDSRDLVERIVSRTGIGELFAQGTRRAAQQIGGEAWKWAMHVKGLEISAYDCRSAPGMALAFGTSPIGGHHKDAFMIAWEDTVDRRGYGVGKVDKLLELQRNRTILECFSVCRFPWLQFSLALDMYVKFFESATGIRVDLAELQNMSDRVYALIRAFWVREHGSSWSRALDRPPQRWFEGPSPRSPTKAQALDPEGYDQMLSWYYEKRGWDSQGIPTIETLNRLGLSHVASELAAPAKT